MRNILLLLVMLMGMSACSKDERFPLRPLSFEIGGKTYYSTRDTRTVYGNIFNVPDPDTLRINEQDGRLSISYSRDTDFINHDMYSIYLVVKGVNTTFETGKKISFYSTDELEEYPYIYLTPIKTSYASDYDLYRAVKGWFEFDQVDWGEKTISGRFEFNAVLEEDNEECEHDKEIEIKNGSFENIPFAISSTVNIDSL